MSKLLVWFPVNPIKKIKFSFLCFSHSITIPEKLEYFINKYAEHSHDRWSMDKVKVRVSHSNSGLSIPNDGSPFRYFWRGSLPTLKWKLCLDWERTFNYDLLDAVFSSAINLCVIHLWIRIFVHKGVPGWLS